MSTFDPVQSMADMRHEFGEHGGVNMSVETSTTFTVLHAQTMPEIFSGRLGPEGGCYLYGRHFNPTVYVLGRQIAAMEGMEAGYCTASGMSAITASILQLCNSGDHIVASTTIYGGTHALLEDFLPAKTGIRTTFVDISDLEAVKTAFTDRTRLIFTETLANPTLVISDIAALANIAHERDAKLVVDNTFTPMIVSPAQLGADVVLHSLTKFISGASDIIAGAVCGETSFIAGMMDLKMGPLMLLGPTMDPNIAFGLSLRLPHLGLRMIEHSRRALEFCKRLRNLGIPTLYPGLEDHPGHKLFDSIRNQEYGSGGLFAIDLGSEAQANEFMEILQNKDRFGYMAVSLGYFDTLMSCSGSTTSSEMSEAQKSASAITPGLVRISLGYTGTLEQRWTQFHVALKILNLIPPEGDIVAH